MAKYVPQCICCGKMLSDKDQHSNYCAGCFKMKKFNGNKEKLSDILFAIAMIMVSIALIIYVRSGRQIKDFEARITTLEQTVQNTK